MYTFLTLYQYTTPLAHMHAAAPKVFLQRMSKQLTPRERAWLFAAESERERLARFYRLWVRAPTASPSPDTLVMYSNWIEPSGDSTV